MLTTDQFEAWCYRLKLSQEAQARVQRIRSSEPARKVNSSAANVSGLYCSKKMGLTIQSESHKVETPLMVTFMEWDTDVLEYYDQPESIKLNYSSAAGKNLGVIYTPDFFIIRTDCAGYEEYKTENELKKLAAKNSERYYKDENGIWRCPPGERFAAQYGLYFKVRSSSDISWPCYRNLEYLQDYFRHPYNVNIEVENILQALVRAEEGIRFIDLMETGGTFTADDLNAMLATGVLYFDIYRCCFDDLKSIQIYTSKKEAELRLGVKSDDVPLLSSPIDIVTGKMLDWDGVLYQIFNVGEHTVTLKSDKNDLLTLDSHQMNQLISSNQLKKLEKLQEDPLSDKVQQIIKNANPKELAIANQRHEIVTQYIRGDKNSIQVPLRTVRDWVKKYNTAKQIFGDGYVGLIPQNGKKGNRCTRISPEVQDLISQIIKEHYENGIQTSIIHAYGFLKNMCNVKGYTAPSYPTFSHSIHTLSTRYDQTLKRQGSRAAYEYQTFYWELERTTPRHGARPFEIVHIDHTEFDIQLKCPQGRPWGTVMIDAFSRRILAVYITMDPPSYRSNMMVIRECVKRFNRLPQNIVVDGGKDFSCTYFDQLLARYEVNKKVRPKAKGHFGSVCERVFGTSNTQLIHNLVGNTQLTKEVRKIVKTFNPKNLAVWDLESFSTLFKMWAYEFYDSDDHPALGESPRSAFQAALELTGLRKNRYISYDHNFEFATLPTTRKGTAKIYPGRGFKLHYIYYWNDEFRIPEIEGKTVDIRYDPWNIGIAYAFIQGAWSQCISEYYSIFAGRTERELMLASEEIRKQKSNSSKKYTISAAQLAEFFQKNVLIQEMELSQKNNQSNSSPLLQVVSSNSEKLKMESESNEKIQMLPSGKKRIVPRQVYEEF